MKILFGGKLALLKKKISFPRANNIAQFIPQQKHVFTIICYAMYRACSINKNGKNFNNAMAIQGLFSIV